MIRMRQEIQVGVSVHVDEARTQDMAFGLDHSGVLVLQTGTNGRDQAILDEHIRHIGDAMIVALDDGGGGE